MWHCSAVGWMQFVNLMVGHVLSWPVFGVVAVVVLRRHLAPLIRRITSYEGLGQKITFGQELAKAEQEVEDLTSSQSDHLPPASQEGSADAENDRYLVLAEQAPTGVLLDAWVRVERAILRLGELHGAQETPMGKSGARIKRAPMPPRLVQIVGYLADRGIIPRMMLRIIDRLRRLRNEVAHGQHEPTPGEATTYAATAREVAEILEKLATLSEPDEGTGDSGRSVA